MKRPRIYVDTSVFGGCFDPEFEADSRRFFEAAAKGEFVLLLSALVATELRRAPGRAQELFASMKALQSEELIPGEESESLCEEYMKARVVGSATRADANHVAVAVVNRADLIVSWNFKHLVHIDRIRGFNATNLLHGYGLVDIRSPKEVV